MTLTQTGKDCPLSVRLGSYDGMAELSEAIKSGMTPIVSYRSANDMLWMDGVGSDGQGPCAADDKDACSETVKFYNFSIKDLGDSTPAVVSSVVASSGNTPPPGFTAASGYDAPSSAEARATSAAVDSEFASAVTAIVASASNRSSPSDGGSCSETQRFDCRETRCCSQPGMQCYEKHEWWAACKEACVPGSVDPEDDPEVASPWSCKKLGPRTPKAAERNGAPRSSSGHGASDEGAPANGTAQGAVVLELRPSAAVPGLAAGKEVTLSLGGQKLRATVLEDGDQSPTDACLKRYDDASPRGSASAAAPAPSALRLAAAAIACACFAVAGAVAARRWLTAPTRSAQLLPVEPASPLPA